MQLFPGLWFSHAGQLVKVQLVVLPSPQLSLARVQILRPYCDPNHYLVPPGKAAAQKMTPNISAEDHQPLCAPQVAALSSTHSAAAHLCRCATPLEAAVWDCIGATCWRSVCPSPVPVVPTILQQNTEVLPYPQDTLPYHLSTT